MIDVRSRGQEKISCGRITGIEVAWKMRRFRITRAKTERSSSRGGAKGQRYSAGIRRQFSFHESLVSTELASSSQWRKSQGISSVAMNTVSDAVLGAPVQSARPDTLVSAGHNPREHSLRALNSDR
jgi:hypothetical protein